jgi:hypothetical protein
MTIEPGEAADNRGAAACGERPMAATAGIAGSTLRVAAPTGVCCRNERRVNFVTVLSFPFMGLAPARHSFSGAA